MSSSGSSRGQVLTIEVVISLVFIVTALLLGLSTVGIATVDSQDSTREQTIQSTLQTVHESGALRNGILCFGGVESGTPPDGLINTESFRSSLGAQLAQTLPDGEYEIVVRVPETVRNGSLSRVSVSEFRVSTSDVPAVESVETVQTILAVQQTDPVREYNETTQTCEPTAVEFGDLSESEMYLTANTDTVHTRTVVIIELRHWQQ